MKPRYFIDFRDGDKLHTDDEGREFRDQYNARLEAIAYLSAVARDELPDGEHRTLIATVRDEAGHDVYRVTLTFYGEWLD